MREEAERETTRKCFHHSSQKCKSVLHVILSLEQWTILPYLKEEITSGEIGEQSFVTQVLFFFAHEYLCQILKK